MYFRSSAAVSSEMMAQSTNLPCCNKVLLVIMVLFGSLDKSWRSQVRGERFAGATLRRDFSFFFSSLFHLGNREEEKRE